MNITKNFTLEELTKSSTAKRLGIDNTPSDDVRAKLIKLAETILQPVRDAFGHSIIVGSGYRCPKLNTAVGGVKNSQHMVGEAADIKTVSDTYEDNMVLWKLICQMVEDGRIKVGQYIFEYGKKSVGPDWIHISLPRTNGKQNNQKVYIGAK